MTKSDARRLHERAQEALRIRAAEAVQRGLTQSEVARLFGVSRAAVSSWAKRVSESGISALGARRRGRPPGPRAPEAVLSAVRQILLGTCPDEVGFPQTLWTREAIRELIQRDHGISVSVSTVTRYLRSWGIHLREPLHKACEADPVRMSRWLHDEYRKVVRRARARAAEVLWCDTSAAGKSGAVLYAMTNRGRSAFMAYTGAFRAEVLLGFLARLLRHTPKRLLLVVPWSPCAEVRGWARAHASRVELVTWLDRVR